MNLLLHLKSHSVIPKRSPKQAGQQSLKEKKKNASKEISFNFMTNKDDAVGGISEM